MLMLKLSFFLCFCILFLSLNDIYNAIIKLNKTTEDIYKLKKKESEL